MASVWSSVLVCFGVLFTPVAQQPRRAAPRAVPAPRTFAVLATDQPRRWLVLFGGVSDSGTFLSDTWELSATGWVRHPTPASPTSPSPSPRAFAVAGFDPAVGQVVMYSGGTFARELDDTWGFTGGRAWRRLAAEGGAGGPGRRVGAMMTADVERRRLVLFGGLGGSSGETWEWDGAAWIVITPDGASPPPRAYGGLAHDPVRRVAVLFGGDSLGTRLGDTWEWNGRSWRERTGPADPAPRYHHAMVYDAGRRVVVLFGGYAKDRLLGDTWEWDGERWTEAHGRVGEAPSPRYGHVMAYDPTRRRIVLFGGTDSIGMTNDTWTWDGLRWTLLARGTPRDTATERLVTAQRTTRRDMAILMNAEQAYFKKNGRYTSNVYDLAPDYRRSFNVYIHFTAASDSGWAAEFTHGMDSHLYCTASAGKVSLSVEEAGQAGQPHCRRSAP